MTQEGVFLGGEGDRYFVRNKAAMTESFVGQDMALRLITESGLKPAKVLEVGCSNGFRLATLAQNLGCAVTGVEPSSEAIRDGQARYPSVTYLQGVANKLPIEASGQFDLVIINFVLHWVGRSALLQSVSELDRMVRDGGSLLVGDFYPPSPLRSTYHHLPDSDIWTFKQDYTAIFVASNLYKSVASLDFNHDTHELGVAQNPGSRGRVTLLRKSLQDHYEAVRFKG
jgi:SAM-dependent methyltransferase